MELRKFTFIPSMIVALGISATSAMAQVGEIPDRYGSFDRGYGMMWGNSQWGGFGMTLGPIFMILLVIGIVAACIYLLRMFGMAGPGGNSHLAHDRALMLLKERYSKGEIDSAEFTERKKLLND